MIHRGKHEVGIDELYFLYAIIVPNENTFPVIMCITDSIAQIGKLDYFGSLRPYFEPGNPILEFKELLKKNRCLPRYIINKGEDEN